MADTKNVVVKGCNFSLSKGKGDVNILETSLPQNNVKAGPKSNVIEVYAGNITVKVENFLSEVVTNGDGVGTGIISGTSNNLANGKKILLEGDNTMVSISGTAFYSDKDPKHPVTDTVTVKISDAGQSEVKTN